MTIDEWPNALALAASDDRPGLLLRNFEARPAPGFFASGGAVYRATASPVWFFSFVCFFEQTRPKA